MTLREQGGGDHALSAGDALVIPPEIKTALRDAAPDLELLEVAMPAQFETREV